MIFPKTTTIVARASRSDVAWMLTAGFAVALGEGTTFEVVDGGAEELLETVGGFEVEGGGRVIAQQQSPLFQGAGDADGDVVEIALKLGARYGAGGWFAPPGIALAAFRERRWLEWTATAETRCEERRQSRWDRTALRFGRPVWVSEGRQRQPSSPTRVRRRKSRDGRGLSP